MTQTKIYCDHCGKELDEMKDPYVDWALDCCMSDDCLTVDLCSDCFHLLEEQVRKFTHKEK